MSLISEERIKEIAWNDVEHAIRIAIRETAEAIVLMLDAVAVTGPLDEERVLRRAIEMIRRLDKKPTP